MKFSDIFEFLSDPDNMSYFMTLLESGMYDEWDTGLHPEIFGPEEWSIAARSAHSAALFHEGQDR